MNRGPATAYAIRPGRASRPGWIAGSPGRHVASAGAVQPAIPAGWTGPAGRGVRRVFLPSPPLPATRGSAPGPRHLERSAPRDGPAYRCPGKRRNPGPGSGTKPGPGPETEPPSGAGCETPVQGPGLNPGPGAETEPPPGTRDGTPARNLGRSPVRAWDGTPAGSGMTPRPSAGAKPPPKAWGEPPPGPRGEAPIRNPGPNPHPGVRGGTLDRNPGRNPVRGLGRSPGPESGAELQFRGGAGWGAARRRRYGPSGVP